jgi:LDH2 family malate/lactate/ureidoglycolate dehydrogenase
VGNPLLTRALSGEPIHPGTQNSFVAAIDIAPFTDLEGYRRNIDELVERIKALPKAEGVDEIFVPGGPEDRVYDERMRQGVPLPDGTAHNLREVAAKLDISLPDWLRAS